MSDLDKKKERLEAFRKNGPQERYLNNLNQLLKDFEPDEDVVEGSFPVIYLVGLPRSGTTLLSQLISRYLPVGYINNLIARFWLNPVAGIRLSQAILKDDDRKRINLKSTHGVTEDPWGPHEFGYFWSHWLNLDREPTHKLSSETLKQVDANGLRLALDRMACAFGAPLFFKNIICGLQASFLSQIHPNSLFILIERDTESVAKSILRCRKERYGDEAVWWSLKPSTYENIRKIESPQIQIENQIIDGTRDFHEELSKSGVKLIRLNYAELCADPLSALEFVAGGITSCGYPISLIETPYSLSEI